METWHSWLMACDANMDPVDFRKRNFKKRSHCVLQLFGREVSGMQRNKSRTYHQCRDTRSELGDKNEAAESKRRRRERISAM